MQRKRLLKLLTGIAVAISVGLIYAAAAHFWDIGISCPFRSATGLYCPGCGISRMFIAIFQLDFKAAFECQPIVFLLILPLSVCFGFMAVDYVKEGRVKNRLWQKVLIFISCAALIVFCVIRNIMLIFEV